MIASIRLLRELFPELYIACDVCLCEYSSHGHCGLFRPDGSLDQGPSAARIAEVALAYARAVPDVLAVLSSLISGLRYREKEGAPTAAEVLLMPTVVRVAELRVQKSFEWKEAADRALSTAVQVLGPEVVLRELPLNIEPADRYVALTPSSI